MEALVFAANIMYVAAYFMTDLLRLRILTVSGAVCLAVYFSCQPQPMWTVVAWNLFFIGLNLFQIARLVRGRMGKPGRARRTAPANAGAA